MIPAHSSFSGIICRPVFTPPAHLFLFYSSLAHRDLHSFPTRRSSDLGRRSDRRQYARVCLFRQGTLLHRRSEEHTSELQSLTNLVCRLLLEKKKKKRKT